MADLHLKFPNYFYKNSDLHFCSVKYLINILTSTNIFTMEIYKRIFILIVAIFLCGLGIAITTQADLGTTPISSLPYVLTFITPLSFGITTVIINILFIIIQILILKKEFKSFDLLQIFVGLVFGTSIDLGMYLSAPFKTHIYSLQILMLVIGSAVLALGITLECCANILYVPGEGVVKAVAYKTSKEFGKLKIGFDCILCFSAILLSLLILHHINGLREGTVISAFLVGWFICLYHKLFTKLRT